MQNSNNASISTLLSNASQHIDALDAEILLAHTLQKPREFFLSHPEVTVSWLERLRFHYALNKRKRGIPLAYLTGHKEFYGLDFIVNKHTLIPRPETEVMVDAVKEQLTTFVPSSSRGMNNEQIRLIDVGTGTGCIPIAIIKTVKHESIKTIAIDISRSALRVARKNAERYAINIRFLRGSLLDPIRSIGSELALDLSSGRRLAPNSAVIITANLPYLTQEQFDEESSIQHEPHSALVAEENGLALYEELLTQINSIIPQFYNSSLALFLEIDPSQTVRIQKLIKRILAQSIIEIKKDLRGQDRVVKITVL